MEFRPEFNKVEEDEKIGVGARFRTHGITWIIVENSPDDAVDTTSITLLNSQTFSVMDSYVVVDDPNWISEKEFSNLYFEAFNHFPITRIAFYNTTFEKEE